ncbi:MAG: hypothetical protein IPI70_05705 [Nitrospira sp.]|nr:hypothetical protein [Nitrospira sp.]
MKTATSMKNLGLGLCVVAAGFMVGGCNTTKATVDTTVNFFSSTSPNGLFSAGGMVLKEQKINLFAGVAYENLRHEAAAGGGQYVSALASLYGIPLAVSQEDCMGTMGKGFILWLLGVPASPLVLLWFLGILK